MAKNKTVGKGRDPKSADAPAVSGEDESDAKVRGKPVSLHPLSFSDALRVMIKTPPPPRTVPRKHK